ncbi:MAG: tRNA (N6-threonylcarbamoyladenosine(37)-N6)-methyltransferase TrmO [Chloroflexi bacterium]|nr:tRNA (N6-threonylcarbamoyladenosine(37)-N6)-methyltransferase TrmO [Chloroflexota bacterium]
MHVKKTRLSLEPIGIVRNGITDRAGVVWEDVVSTLHVEPRYAEALEGLEAFSHIWVVWWLDRSPTPESLRVHPQGRQDMPPVGLFATRSPVRPNPIAVTAVRLLAWQGVVLRVQGLDALDGTPVLDIKPYLPGDIVGDAVYPEWALRLHRAGPALHKQDIKESHDPRSY